MCASGTNVTDAMSVRTHVPWMMGASTDDHSQRDLGSNGRRLTVQYEVDNGVAVDAITGEPAQITEHCNCDDGEVCLSLGCQAEAFAGRPGR